MTITFVDAGVLIAAARGRPEISAQAMAILDDPDRTFASSEFIRLEVLPKALFNKKFDEAEFYLEFFQAVTRWPANTDAVVRQAYEMGVKFGLAAHSMRCMSPPPSAPVPKSWSQPKSAASLCIARSTSGCVQFKLTSPYFAALNPVYSSGAVPHPSARRCCTSWRA
jgi:hypothetical protein